MAVYTDVAADELAEFLGAYDIGELLSYKGIAEGVENSNFLLHTTKGSFFLTLYEKRVAVGDLPFFLGLMGHLAGARHHLSAAGEDARAATCWARWPAGPPRSSIFSKASGHASRTPRHCAAVGAGAGENASGRARFSDDARQRAVGVGLAAAVRAGRRARR